VGDAVTYIEYICTKKGWTHDELMKRMIGLMEYLIKKEDDFVCRKKRWNYENLVGTSIGLIQTFVLHEDDWDLFLISKDKKLEKRLLADK